MGSLPSQASAGAYTRRDNLQSSDLRIVDYLALRKSLHMHGLKDCPCTLWLLPSFARADQMSVGYRVLRKSLQMHGLKDFPSMLWLLHLFAIAYQRIVGYLLC